MKKIGVWLVVSMMMLGTAAMTVWASRGPAVGGVIPPLPTCALPTVLAGVGCPTPCLLGIDQPLCMTPSPTAPGTPNATPSATPTVTATGPESTPPSETPIETPEASATPTDTPTPTETPTETPTPTPVPLVGDVDCNRAVNTVDAALVLQYSAGYLALLACQQTGDINGDHRVNSVDASFVLQYVARLVEELPHEFLGSVVTVHGRETDCFALDTGKDAWVLFDPTGLSLGEHVRVIGFIDRFAAFCGVTPLLHNVTIEHLD